MQKKPPLKEGYICVGVILGAHGIKGALRVKSFCENPVDIASYGVLSTLEVQNFTPITAGTAPKGAVRLVLEEVTDRNTSENLKGTYLYVLKTVIPTTEDETLQADLIGLPVLLQGKEIGTLAGIFSNGAQDVLEIQTPEKMVLIPWVEDYAVLTETEILLSVDAQAFFEL